jgi:phage regulator Rha-like protein
MSNLTLTPAGITMSSDELLRLINEARTEAGEPSLRRNKLAEKIEDELAGEHYTKRVVQNLNSTESNVFDLTRDQCMLVAMRESKSVRRRVVAKLNELEAKLAKPAPAELSHLEILQLAIESGQRLIAAEAERDKAIRDAVVTVERVLHGLLGKVSPGEVLQVGRRNSQSPGAIRTRAYRERKKAAAESETGQ